MKKIKFYFILFLIFYAFGCTCKTCLKNSYDFELPEHVKQNAENYIIEKTGKTFFDNYIFPDYINSKKIGNNYELHYILTIPGKDFVKEPIIFTVDTNGNILQNFEIIGIPDCYENPEDGTFNITEKEAENIAINAGLSKGIKKWKIDFLWSAEFAKYVWHILSINSEMHYDDGYKASGEEIIINPYDGKIIAHRNWSIK